MNDRTILYVRKESEWKLYAGTQFLYAELEQSKAISRALELIQEYPDRYEICVEDGEEDYDQQHQCKRRDQVEFSAGVSVVGIAIVLGLQVLWIIGWVVQRLWQ